MGQVRAEVQRSGEEGPTWRQIGIEEWVAQTRELGRL